MTYVLTQYEKTEQEADAKKYAAIAEKLGLEVQANRYRVGRSIERDFKPLSADEWLVWQAFCPTFYAKGAEPEDLWLSGGNRHGYHQIRMPRRPLADYKHDTIPAEVLAHWAEITERYAFDSFQIRTTEKASAAPMRDPILVGIYGQAAYLLARWGLESPGALPMKEVAKRVMKMRFERCVEDYWAGFLQNRRESRQVHESDQIWQAASRLTQA